ncbi:hypothetical protein D9M73_131540 [compost metagenome]
MPGQQQVGMDAALVRAELIHIARIVLRLGAVRPGGAPRPVIGVAHPAGAGIDYIGKRGDRVQAFPVGRRVGPVDRLGIVEAVVAHGHELRVEIGDFALGIGEQRVVRRIGLALGNLPIAGEIVRLGAQPALFECGDRLPHQRLGNPFAPAFGDDRAVV